MSMYMGRTRTYKCPNCGKDVFVQIDRGDNVQACQECGVPFRYDDSEALHVL